MVVGGEARHGHLSHPDLRLRRPLAVDERDERVGPGAGAVHVARREPVVFVGGGRPVAEGALGGRGLLGVGEVARHDERHAPGLPGPRVEGTHVLDRAGAQAGRGADRQVPVRVAVVEQRGERAVGDRGRQVAQLQEAVEAQLADAGEIVLRHAGPADDVGEQVEDGVAAAGEREHREQRGVGADLGVELRAEPREGRLELEGRERAAPLVQHVGGERREAGPVVGVLGGAVRQQQQGGQHRHLAVLDGPDAEAVGELPPLDGGKAERPLGFRRRQARPIHPAHEHTTLVEPGSARSRRPRGTTLSATRGAFTSTRSAASRTPSAVATRYRSRSRSR